MKSTRSSSAEDTAKIGDMPKTSSRVRKIRIPRDVERFMQFSAPAPGRPKVWWTEGIDPELVREHWGSQGDVPFEESTFGRPATIDLPGGRSLNIEGSPLRTPCLERAAKLVVYERSHPQVRLVLLLGAPYENTENRTRQPILRASVERDSGIDPWETRDLERRLWDEVCRVERRGRPRGTGHPKRPLWRDLTISATDIDHLRREGLDDKDLRILFDRLRNKTFPQIGRDLGMSTTGAWRRFVNRVEPVIKKLNRSYSRTSFRLISSNLE